MKRNEKQLAYAFVQALDGASKAQVEAASIELVDQLRERHELHRLGGVMDAIEVVWRERYGAATVTIETAYEISGALRRKLELLAPGAELRERLRPQIIGGARLRIDDTIIDGSIEGHLQQLNQALRNA
jgi:F0F1-type ATP synthase delta subunit